MDTEYTAENYMVNANEYELVYFMDANDNEIMAYAINNTDTAMEVKDCLIGGVSVDDYDLENGGLTVIFPGGIQMGASKDAAVSYTHLDVYKRQEGACPQILERLVETNLEQTIGYSEDEYCKQAREKIKKACDAPEADVHFLVGGTQTNYVAVSYTHLDVYKRQVYMIT